MLTRTSGAPVLPEIASHMFLPSSDMRARAIPFGPPAYHQTTSPSASMMNATVLF